MGRERALCAVDNTVGFHSEKATQKLIRDLALYRFSLPDDFEFLPARSSGGRVLHVRGLQGGAE